MSTQGALRWMVGFAALAVACLLVGCAPVASSQSRASPSVKPTPTATPSPTPSRSPSPSPTANPSPMPPGGFEPVAVTAISDTQFWVLGSTGNCSGSGCLPQIWRTGDGGHAFTPVPAPPAEFANYSGYPSPPTAGSPSSLSISNLRFADSLDGWAFGPGLWSTHDGGTHWRSVPLSGAVEDLEPGSGGYVYAVVDACVPGEKVATCPIEVVRGRVTQDAWTVVLSVNGVDQPPPALGVHGTGIWLLVTSGLWRSLDAGTSFTRLPDPCAAELGGRVYPVSSTAIWAFCPTGMEGGPWVSTNGGMSFRSAYGGDVYSNGGSVAPLSASTAFVTLGRDGDLVKTVDGGASYQPVTALPHGARWLGFTDTSVGYGLVDNGDGTGSQLWRTGDGGAHWALVTVP